MRKRVYLHVGWEKTGSSSLQGFCARNQRWLQKRGVHYPLMGQLPQHMQFFQDLRAGYSSKVQRSFKKIRSEIERCEQDVMVFSHESLHMCNPAMFSKLFEDCDVRVVAYTRRPDAAMISHFVTMVRFGQLPVHKLYTSVRFYAKANLRSFDYYWTLRGFVNAFGRDALVVRHYDRDELVGGQTVSDFMHVLGIDDLSGSMWPEDQANLSLDVDQFALVLAFAKSLQKRPGMIKKLNCKLSNAMIRNTTPDRLRSVERFVPVSFRERLLSCWSGSFPMLYDEFFDGRPVFEDTSWVDQSEAYSGMDTRRAAEFEKVVLKAKAIPDEHRDGLCRLIEGLVEREAVVEELRMV